jgi:hypothetical protein
MSDFDLKTVALVFCFCGFAVCAIVLFLTCGDSDD